jgi:hypothetical protein
VALFIKRGESLFREITCPKLELWRSARVSRLNALGFLHFLVLKDFKKGPNLENLQYLKLFRFEKVQIHKTLNLHFLRFKKCSNLKKFKF